MTIVIIIILIVITLSKCIVNHSVLYKLVNVSSIPSALIRKITIDPTCPAPKPGFSGVDCTPLNPGPSFDQTQGLFSEWS